MIARTANTARITLRAARRVGRLPLPRRIDHGAQLELVDHLDEVRSRIIVVLGVVIAAFALAFAYHERIIELLNGTLPPGVPQPVTLGVAEPFMTSIKISLYAAFAVAFPVIVWQAWGFVSPVFDDRGRRSARIFMVAGSLLFVAGVAFAYAVALPSAITFLTTYDANLYDVQLRAREFYTFAAAVLVSVGLVFELPILMLGLMRFGVLPSERLRRNRKYCYLGLTVLAVLLPGVDPVLTTMMLAPLALLFEGTLAIGRVLERRWRLVEIREEP